MVPFAGTCGEVKYDVSNELKPVGTGRGAHFYSDNGTCSHFET